MGAGLKAEESFWDDQEGIRSLFKHGFYPVQMPDGKMKLRSSDGEVEVLTKSGVVYLFRFGEVAGIEQGSEESKLNRFVMVTASLDDSVFEKPAPPEGLELDQADDSQSEENAAESKAADNEETDEEDAEAEDTETSESESEADQKQAELLKKYTQELDDYNEQIAQAGKRVKDLNYRFSDWYYVIPEDEYKKIHLRRSDVVTVREVNEDEGFGFDSLRKLESDGLRKEQPVPPVD